MSLHQTLSDLALAFALAGAPMGGGAAGRVEVHFVDPPRYTDAGRSAVDRERTTAALQAHMQAWAARLGPAQALRVDVLDVDLAGALRPTGRGDEVRVLRGGADVPRLALRYTLVEGGRTVAEGEDTLADLAYLQAPVRGDGNALPYETRLLDRWFYERIARAKAQ